MRNRIVLTGGPGAGKSTAADLIRRELGEKIVVVPEAATLLFRGGFPRTETVGAKEATQKAIYQVQRNMEDVQAELYPDRVLLCDRGTIDGVIYWPLEAQKTFFESVQSSLASEYARYDAVIFFETAAAGSMSIEGGNPYRCENSEKAVELDRELREVWSGHPHFKFVGHQKSFFKKLEGALTAIQDTINALQSKKQTQ